MSISNSQTPTSTGGPTGTNTPTVAGQAVDAAKTLSDTPNDQTNSLTSIFNSEIASQTALFAQITALNDQKNKISSFLTLAKSVSEKVS